jgi:hypothetical protein
MQHSTAGTAVILKLDVETTREPDEPNFFAINPVATATVQNCNHFPKLSCNTA